MSINDNVAHDADRRSSSLRVEVLAIENATSSGKSVAGGYGKDVAKIPRRVKADPEFTNFGDNLSRIRRPQYGDLMLELKEFKDITAERHLG